MKTVPAVLIALTLSACATTTNTGPPFEEQFAATIPKCSSDAQCDRMWEATELFIVKNSGLKIQNSSNVVIQTFNSPQNSPLISTIATKEPDGTGGKQIVFRAGCNNIFRCAVNKKDLMLRFNAEIGAIE